MDISSEKIGELLKNPEMMGMIASVMGNMLSGGVKGDAPIMMPSEKKDVDGDDDLGVNDKSVAVEEAFIQKPDMFSPSDGELDVKDKRIALLNAIKPYVSSSKRERVDGLVKAIGVAGVLSNYTGMLFGNAKK